MTFQNQKAFIVIALKYNLRCIHHYFITSFLGISSHWFIDAAMFQYSKIYSLCLLEMRSMMTMDDFNHLWEKQTG